MTSGPLPTDAEPSRTPPPGPAWLFCPADRPDRYGKALAAADLVILDLEDAVSAEQKDEARRALISEPLDPARVIVRVNPAGGPQHASDVEALRQTSYTRVMLAKAESEQQIQALQPWDVVALLETPLGIVNATAIAQARGVIGLMWGAEDLVAAMGGRSSRHADGRYRDFARHARSATLLAAHAAGRFAVDSVFIDIADLDGLGAEAEDAVSSGFAYKACIHPTQADGVRQAFRPSEESVAWARRVIAAGGEHGGVISVDGQMIDAPLIRQAEQILAGAGGRGPGEGA